MSQNEIIIIGAGPAGYTAAIYLARAKLAPLVLGGELAGGQLMFTTEVENYPGFPEGILGPELMNKMRNQAVKFGADIKNVSVTKVDLKGKLKKVWVGDTLYQAKAVIVTIGASARMLNIGEERYLGRGVSTCAVCDAAFFKDKVTYVVGGGDAAIEDAMALKRHAKTVVLIHRRDELRASKIMQERLKEAKIPILWNSEVVSVEGETRLEAITVKSVSTGKTEKLPADGLFLAIGHLPTTSLFEGKLVLDERKYLITKQTSNEEKIQRQILLDDYPTQTSKEGVFAAGDVVDIRYRQAITAAGMGCQAALDAEKYLTGTFGSW